MSLDQDTAVRGLLDQRSELLAYIRAIVSDPSLADDVFQDLALVLLRKHGEVADLTHLAGWLRRSARFLALDQLRKRRREQPFDGEVMDIIDHHWQAQGPVDGQPLRAALRRCCQALTPRSQRLIAMRYHEQRSGTEMATALGRPVNTVYVALSRIHKALTDCVRRTALMESADAT